jgi:3-hydroxyisobutyrate dehydrogenase-like beta-hydroxyacid dehydrogenase
MYPMASSGGSPVSVLGLGAMGNALASALIDAGHPTTVWNRTAGRDTSLVARGAYGAPTLSDAVTAAPVVIACLLDHASVHETLDPVTDELRGRALVNLTTTTPNQSRELAAWAATNGIDYLNGGIMAVPSMIGMPTSSILYSGSEAVFETYRPILDRWGAAEYFGDDAGMASLYDLALLAGMYIMFAGFFHGAALVGSQGVTAGEFAAKAVPWLTAMASSLPEYAEVIDGGDYAVPGQQSLEFSDLNDLLQASADQGISTDAVAMVQALIRRQIDAGYGDHGFARIYESIRHPANDHTVQTSEAEIA